MDDILIAYVCNRQKCDNCNPECTHTTDIKYADHFTKLDNGRYMELTPAYHKILNNFQMEVNEQ